MMTITYPDNFKTTNLMDRCERDAIAAILSDFHFAAVSVQTDK